MIWFDGDVSGEMKTMSDEFKFDLICFEVLRLKLKFIARPPPLSFKIHLNSNGHNPQRKATR